MQHQKQPLMSRTIEKANMSVGEKVGEKPTVVPLVQDPRARPVDWARLLSGSGIGKTVR